MCVVTMCISVISHHQPHDHHTCDHNPRRDFVRFYACPQTHTHTHDDDDGIAVIVLPSLAVVVVTRALPITSSSNSRPPPVQMGNWRLIADILGQHVHNNASKHCTTCAYCVRMLCVRVRVCLGVDRFSVMFVLICNCVLVSIVVMDVVMDFKRVFHTHELDLKFPNSCGYIIIVGFLVTTSGCRCCVCSYAFWSRKNSFTHTHAHARALVSIFVECGTRALLQCSRGGLFTILVCLMNEFRM